MIKKLQRLATPFMLSGTLALGGCATTQMHFDEERCTTSETSSLKVLLLLEFETTSPGQYHQACDEGKKASRMTLAALNPDRSLSKFGALYGQRYVSRVMDKLNKGEEPDYQRSCLSFYDHFLGKEGYSIEQVFDPSSYKLCKGNGLIRECR
ncbi:MAG: hypothetical protein WC043_09875 [Pseudobdellovibrionaceae bacterium]